MLVGGVVRAAGRGGHHTTATAAGLTLMPGPAGRVIRTQAGRPSGAGDRIYVIGGSR